MQLKGGWRHIVSDVDDSVDFKVARVKIYYIWKLTGLCNFDVPCGKFYFVIGCRLICNYLSVV